MNQTTHPPIASLQPKYILETIDSFGTVTMIRKNNVNRKISDKPLIRTSRDAYNLLLHHWDKQKMGLVEEFKILFLNRRGRVLQLYHLGQGGIRGVIADIQLIMAAALQLKSHSILLAHNHPSGTSTPSESDTKLTFDIIKAAHSLSIKVNDHIILSCNRYYSYKDEGRI